MDEGTDSAMMTKIINNGIIMIMIEANEGNVEETN
jgi:hypothetical protein